MSIVTAVGRRIVWFRVNECTDCGVSWETPEDDIPTECRWQCKVPCTGCGELGGPGGRRCECADEEPT